MSIVRTKGGILHWPWNLLHIRLTLICRTADYLATGLSDAETGLSLSINNVFWPINFQSEPEHSVSQRWHMINLIHAVYMYTLFVCESMRRPTDKFRWYNNTSYSDHIYLSSYLAYYRERVLENLVFVCASDMLWTDYLALRMYILPSSYWVYSLRTIWLLEPYRVYRTSFLELYQIRKGCYEIILTLPEGYSSDG